MESNESISWHTGEVVSLPGDYRAACCDVGFSFARGITFPSCPEHGETDWKWMSARQSGLDGLKVLQQFRSQMTNYMIRGRDAFRGTVRGTLITRGETPLGTPAVLRGTVPPAVPPLPELPIVLQAAITVHGRETTEGDLIESVGPAWLAFLDVFARDPGCLAAFKDHPREFEELLAAAYKAAGWPEVTLTPRSGDHGRDVIVAKPGNVAVRFFDQAKAFAPGRRVTANDVRAMLGVLSGDQNVSKGIITTTAAFAPGIQTDPLISPFLPYRLELRDGEQLASWLAEFVRR